MLKVLKSGFYTTIQDKGRIGFSSIGVPVSGAMDSYSADLANGILNNSLNDAVLEITFGGAEFEFLEPTVICVTGGDFLPELNGKYTQLNKRVFIDKGDKLSFGKINYGVRCYIAVKGGFLSKVILNSRSFYQNITPGFIIKKNDNINYQSYKGKSKPTKSSIKIDRKHFDSNIIVCNKGPEFNLLSQDQQEKIVSQKFTISNDNSRMGYKLDETIENDLPQILTSAVIPGTVQLTRSGKLIVLMKDCQVTGGYPRVLQLLESSVSKMAQKTTGSSFYFIIL